MIAVEGSSKLQTGEVVDLGRGDVRWRQRFDNVQRAIQVLERSATHLAFQIDLISDGEGWMAMIKARNQSSHTYNHEQAQAIARDVIERFAALTAPAPLLRLCNQNSFAAAVADLGRPEEIGQRRPQRSSPSVQSPRISRPAPPQTRRSGRSLRPPPTSRSGSKPSRWK